MQVITTHTELINKKKIIKSYFEVLGMKILEKKIIKKNFNSQNKAAKMRLHEGLCFINLID